MLLDDLRKASGTSNIDDFDLICHIAYDKKPLTKSERVANVKKSDYFSQYEGLAREVLSELLNKYADDGITDLEDTKVLTLDPFRSMGMMKIAKAFGGKQGFRTALMNLQNQIYAV